MSFKNSSKRSQFFVKDHVQKELTILKDRFASFKSSVQGDISVHKMFFKKVFSEIQRSYGNMLMKQSQEIRNEMSGYYEEQLHSLKLKMQVVESQCQDQLEKTQRQSSVQDLTATKKNQAARKAHQNFWKRASDSEPQIQSPGAVQKAAPFVKSLASRWEASALSKSTVKNRGVFRVPNSDPVAGAKA